MSAQQITRRELLYAAWAAAERHHEWRNGKPLLDGWCSVLAAALDALGIEHPYVEPPLPDKVAPMPELVYADLVHREPWRSVIEHLNNATNALMNHTGRKGITRVSLEPTVGLALGIVPGTSMDVNLPAGRVELYCEKTEHFEGAFTIRMEWKPG